MIALTIISGACSSSVPQQNDNFPTFQARLIPVSVGAVPKGRAVPASGSWPYRNHRSVAEIRAGVPTRLPASARGGR